MASKFLELKQREHDLTAELTAMAARLEAEGTPLTDTERNRRAEIVGDGGELAAVKEAIAIIEESRSMARNSEEAGEDPNALAEALSAGRSVTQPQGVKVFSSIGQQLQAIANAAKGDFGARNKLLAAASGQGEGVDADGAFLLQPDFTAGIEEIMHDQGQILQLLNPTPVSGNELVMRVLDEKSRADGSRNGGVLGYWVDEGTAPNLSTLKFARVRVPLEKLAVVGYATDELLADVSALGAEMQDDFAEELVFKTEDAVIEGSGAGMPLGILNANCLITVDKETGQAAKSIVTTNLSKMWQRFHPRSRANGVWLINSDVEPQLDELTLPGGTAALEPRFVSYGQDGILRIKGRPVLVVEYASTVGTVGDIILADFSQYKMIDKDGIQQASSIHVRFLQDETTFRATYRVGGQPIWRQALTPFKGAGGGNDTQSPFVALATRA